jgi:hypothetical protein
VPAWLTARDPRRGLFHRKRASGYRKDSREAGGRVEIGFRASHPGRIHKIARGFESDLEDVEFLLRQKLVEWEELEVHFKSILPGVIIKDIDPKEFQQYFETLRRKVTG